MGLSPSKDGYCLGGAISSVRLTPLRRLPYTRPMKDMQHGEPKPVSIFYLLGLVMLSVGTASISFCSNQVLPLTIKKFTASTALIGFVLSLQAFNQLWATPFAAWKSDRIWTRFGRRKPLVMVIAPILVLSVVLVPHAPTLALLIMTVFFLQMAEDADLAVLMPSICDSVPDKQRPLGTGMWQFAVAIAGFMMGRYVLKLMDRAEHFPYTIAGITVIITSMIYLRTMRERYVPPRPEEKFRPFSYGKEIFQIREHLLIYIIFFFQPLFYLVSIAFFSLLGTETLHLTRGQYGMAFSWGPMTTLLTSIPFGYFFNRYRHRKAFCIGACIYVFLPLTFGLFYMKTAHDMAIFFAAQIIAFNVFRLNFMPYVMEYTTPKNVGTILGFTNGVNGLIRFTMLPLAGLLVDLAGKNYRLPLYGGYIGAIACIIALLMMRPPEKVRHLLGDG